MRIPAGYRVAIVTPDGTIADMIDIADDDLSNPIAAAHLCGEVAEIIAAREALR